MSSTLTVRRLPPDLRIGRAAMHLAMDTPLPHDGRDASPVLEILETAERQGLSIPIVVGAYRGDDLAAACFPLESPGRAALVLLPSISRSNADEPAITAALIETHRAAQERGVALLQVLLAPDASGTARAASRAGFRYLTRLMYLDRPAAAPVRRPVPEGYSWLGYTAEREPLFAAALEATYAQTLDCAELVGLRSVSDVLAGHRATGVHDPALWWLLMRGDKPAGALLLTRIPQRGALEVVYLGLAQPYRGQELGEALVSKALEACGAVGATRLTLAVDDGNTPARRLYERCGFVQFAERDAWIATPLCA
jgi:ribosomal protein S18 acetylase RimI-like enzyme